MALPDFYSLTSKQKKVFSAIESYIKSKGIPPTVREIGEMVGEKTPGAVQGILNRLEQKGVIKRQVGTARSIQIVSQESALYTDTVYIPELKKISSRNIGDLLNIYNIVRYHPFSSDLIDSGGSYFMLKCPDNSLSESGIKYGDMLVASMDYTLKDGDIIIALYENHTLVRYYYSNPQEDLITLRADTDLLEKETFKRSEVSIAGKLVCRCTFY